MSIEITQDRPDIRADHAALRRCLRLCLKQMNFGRAEVSVFLTTDAEIRKLNKRHRGKDQSTDILSFGMREYRRPEDPLPPHPEVLGDLVISLDTVQRQAQARGASLQEELHFIAIHGLLHLLGYDHATPTEELRMKACHQSLLALCQPAARPARQDRRRRP